MDPCTLRTDFVEIMLGLGAFCTETESLERISSDVGSLLFWIDFLGLRLTMLSMDLVRICEISNIAFCILSPTCKQGRCLMGLVRIWMISLAAWRR